MEESSITLEVAVVVRGGVYGPFSPGSRGRSNVRRTHDCVGCEVVNKRCVVKL